MEFESWKSFLVFERSIKTTFRYIHGEEAHKFLETVLYTSKSRIEEIPSGSILYRAQMGCDKETVMHEDGESWDNEIPYSRERMKPMPGRASDGRANSRGIPVLYLSSDLKTALSEVRPWVGSKCTVGIFQTNKSLKLIDFSKDNINSKIYLKEPGCEKKESIVWGDINKAFSKPVTNDEFDADYVSTQIITEVFKKNGYDGIVYKSNLGPSHNIALFKLEDAVIVGRHVYEIKSVNISEEEIINESIYYSG